MEESRLTTVFESLVERVSAVEEAVDRLVESAVNDKLNRGKSFSGALAGFRNATITPQTHDLGLASAVIVELAFHSRIDHWVLRASEWKQRGVAALLPPGCLEKALHAATAAAGGGGDLQLDSAAADLRTSDFGIKSDILLLGDYVVDAHFRAALPRVTTFMIAPTGNIATFQVVGLSHGPGSIGLLDMVRSVVSKLGMFPADVKQLDLFPAPRQPLLTGSITTTLLFFGRLARMIYPWSPLREQELTHYGEQLRSRVASLSHDSQLDLWRYLDRLVACQSEHPNKRLLDVDDVLDELKDLVNWEEALL